MSFLCCPNPYTKDNTPEGIQKCYWFKMLWDRALSLFEWKGELFEGVDATLNADYLEYVLMTQGEAAFIKDKQGKLRGLRCSKVGLDPYGFPEEILVANHKLGNLKGKVNKDCVWVRNNKFATPTVDVIKNYACQLAKIQTSLNVSLSNNRLANVFSAENDEQAQAIRKMIDDIDAGRLAVIQKPDIFQQIVGNKDSNGMMVYSTSSQYLADKYIQNIRETLNDFYTTFGINSNGANMSKSSENLVVEVNSNNQQIMLNRVYWLEPRQQAAKLASELFNTEISVEIRNSNIEEVNEDVLNEQYSDESSDNISGPEV